VDKMPKLVCVKCQCELKPETDGTTVIETASFGPYKVWEADTWKCPGCGIEIISGFAQQPLREDHYADDFPEWLEQIKSIARRVEYDNKKPNDT
jgi:hypothetical protein